MDRRELSARRERGLGTKELAKLFIGHIGVLAAAALLIGCTGGNEAQGTTGGDGATAGAKPTAKAVKVGLVFDSGGKGDKSFNDSANAGLERAVKELGVGEPKTIDSKSEKDYEGNITALAEECQVVFAVGLTQADALKNVAPKYPDVKFAIIDGQVDAPNVRSLNFEEEQGSFLAGYAAALASKTHKIGFVGGMNFPLIKKFEVGYAAGALSADTPATLLPARYTNSWDDVLLGKAAASVLFNGGADIVYSAAGRCGLGVIDAAKEAHKWAIGVDSDQDDVAKGTVLTSMIKRVDNSVFQTIKDVQDGTFTPGTKVYDLAAGGVGLSDFRNTKDVIGEANLKKVEEMSKRIVSGEIKVPKTPEELKSFVVPAKK